MIGTSFSPGSAVWAAAEKPEAIRSLILIGAFVRDPQTSASQKLMLTVLLNGPWKVRAWDMYYKTLYPTNQPADLDTYRAALRAKLHEPGRFAALKAMGAAPKADAEQRLGEVQAPALVVMGSNDPDWPSPSEEARFIADQLNGQLVMVEGAGHYPQTEMPEQVVPPVLEFLSDVKERPSDS